MLLGLSMGGDAPFLAPPRRNPHRAKISLHPCGAVGDGEGMHGAGVSGDPRGFLTQINVYSRYLIVPQITQKTAKYNHKQQQAYEEEESQ